MSNFTINVVVRGGGGTQKPVGDTSLKEKEKADEARESGYLGLAKQAVGYIPGGSEAMGAAGSVKNVAALGMGGLASINGAFAIASMALSLAVKVGKELYEYKREERNTRELQRRAGVESYKRR